MCYVHGSECLYSVSDSVNGIVVLGVAVEFGQPTFSFVENVLVGNVTIIKTGMTVNDFNVSVFGGEYLETSLYHYKFHGGSNCVCPNFPWISKPTKT